jgi:hypothetical protein
MSLIRRLKCLPLFFCGFIIFSLNACNVNRVGVHIDAGDPVVKNGPPQHAPAHGYRAKHRYHYYPNAYVYFDLSRKIYFYLEGNIWRMSVSLPNSLSVNLGAHVAIEMDSDKPYDHFDSHKKKYPPGQMKKKNKWAKKKTW